MDIAYSIRAYACTAGCQSMACLGGAQSKRQAASLQNLLHGWIVLCEPATRASKRRAHLADAEEAGAAERLHLARPEPAGPQEVARHRQLAGLRFQLTSFSWAQKAQRIWVTLYGDLCLGHEVARSSPALSCLRAEVGSCTAEEH